MKYASTQIMTAESDYEIALKQALEHSSFAVRGYAESIIPNMTKYNHYWSIGKMSDLMYLKTLQGKVKQLKGIIVVWERAQKAFEKERNIYVG